MNGSLKTYTEARQILYENIIDEAMFISRASEGAVDLDWIMNQPISIRKKYLEQFRKEVKERQEKINKKNFGKKKK